MPESPDDRALAVSYIRVSTKEQAERDGDPEGYSIPAQRAANKRKAAAIGAMVVEEFVDRGESARSADRPQLQTLLRYIKAHQVKYVIVHKVDRLARNRIDDVTINLAIRQSGAQLVSATENIDETASGMLLHGIMSSIAEFYSRNLAAEVVKGMEQKARTGGTPGKAPLGYRNVGVINSDGREVRSVEVDPERGPLMAWAFEQYATGEWTLPALAAALEARGLTARASRNRPSQPVRANSLAQMLHSPYYKGVVTYQGVTYPGRHKPLVDAQTWQQVQDVLSARKTGERSRQHPHYLKSTVYCGSCGSRLIVTMAKNHQGVIYPYFICIGRQKKLTDCRQKALHIHIVEERVEDAYRNVRLTADQHEHIQQLLATELAHSRAAVEAVQRDLSTRRDRLLAERSRLLQAHYADAIPLDLLKTEQDRIARQLVDIEQRLETSTTELGTVEANLKTALHYATNCHHGYKAAPNHLRRLYNQAFFKRIEVVEDQAATVHLSEPFETIHAVARQAGAAETPDALAGHLEPKEAHSRSAPTLMPSSATATTRPEKAKHAPCDTGLNAEVLVRAVGFEPTTAGV